MLLPTASWARFQPAKVKSGLPIKWQFWLAPSKIIFSVLPLCPCMVSGTGSVNALGSVSASGSVNVLQERHRLGERLPLGERHRLGRASAPRGATLLGGASAPWRMAVQKLAIVNCYFKVVIFLQVCMQCNGAIC
jgi:hypothetical protein